MSGFGTGTVERALVRLHVARVSGARSSSPGRIYSTACGWDEQTVTWEARPALDRVVDAPVGGAAAFGALVEFDVSSAVSGDGVYCFAIENSSTDGVSYNSREAPVNGPEVLLTTVPVAAVLESDGFVDADAPTTNFGTSALLQADGSPEQQMFLRFHVSGLGARPVTAARLRLQVADVTNAQSVSGGRVHHLTSCAWDETQLTWNTRPAIDGALLGEIGPVSRSQIVEFDVAAALAGDGDYCFAIETPGADGVDYNSRESGGEPPAMVVAAGL